MDRASVPARSQGILDARAPSSWLVRRLLVPTQGRLHRPLGGGIALLAATIVGIAWANSPWSATYFHILYYPLVIDLGVVREHARVIDWINEGAMALFFFGVGLEIKEALIHGELASTRSAVLPVIAAIASVIVPAAIYLAFTWGTPATRGWAIPTTTDIAFVIGVLSAVPGVAAVLRAFTLGYSATADIVGVIVIAALFSHAVDPGALAAAAVVLGAFWAFRLVHPKSSGVTFVLGALCWFAVLHSGIHASVVGVPLGLLLAADPPRRGADLADELRALADGYGTAAGQGDHRECERLEGALEEISTGTESAVMRAERRLRPWVTYLVLPGFALANAGVVLDGHALGIALRSAPALGTFFGLLVGAPSGIGFTIWLGRRLGLGGGLASVDRRALAGLAMLGGVGFTVALFIADLAFGAEPAQLNAIKAAILAASTVTGVLGYLLLRAGTPRPGAPPP